MNYKHNTTDTLNQNLNLQAPTLRDAGNYQLTPDRPNRTKIAVGTYTDDQTNADKSVIGDPNGVNNQENSWDWNDYSNGANIVDEVVIGGDANPYNAYAVLHNTTYDVNSTQPNNYVTPDIIDGSIGNINPKVPKDPRNYSLERYYQNGKDGQSPIVPLNQAGQGNSELKVFIYTPGNSTPIST